MGHVAVADLAYAHPGGEMLFFDVSFNISPGEKVGLVGDNGVGKSTLFRLIAGEIEPTEGKINLGGTALTMAQDIGFTDPDESVREMLLKLAPGQLGVIGMRMVRAERRLAEGDADAGMTFAAAIVEWGDHGGYELESRWDSAIHRVLRSSLDIVGGRKSSELSGGERKQVVLETMLSSPADTLLLDEPDNYLDIPAKLWLERSVRESDKTVLMISHDRETLSSAVSKIITLEGSGCWIHNGSYSTYPEARRTRQEKLGDELQRWKDEERRLYRHFKLMKQRAAQNDKNAPKADAAESRWKRFVAAGQPPAPVRDQRVAIRLPGSESARRALRLDKVSVDGLIKEFSDEIRFGERVGLIGPNGSGKTSLLQLLSGESAVEHAGDIVLGSRVSPGIFTQVSDRPDFAGRLVIDIIQSALGEEERSMSALARYGLQNAARRAYETLSGGQKARLEILDLELRGHNFLLLDEPTDHLDLDSSAALEHALDSFEGTLIAVSHDRAFLRKMSRYLLLAHDGHVYDVPDYELAMTVLLDPGAIKGLKRVRRLSA